MSPALETFLDTWPAATASPLAAALGAGAAVSTAFFTWFPEMGQGYDPGLILLLTLGVPMVVVAGVAMAWARSWRRRRAAAFPTPVRPRRARRSPGSRSRTADVPPPGPQPARGALIRSTEGGAVSSWIVV